MFNPQEKAKMRATRSALGSLMIAALLAGCASDVPLDDNKAAPVETRAGTAVDPNAGSAGTSQSQVTSVDLTKSQQTAQLSKTIYFDFDSFVVRDEFRPTIEQYAKLLNADRKKKLTIEGHTDERGGREYNLALGQKRAEAVQKSLTLLGVNATQIEAVSFGKERPAVQGGDEAAWARNRRAELIQK
jgi:peptidoglycan-associated lipoprotein